MATAAPIKPGSASTLPKYHPARMDAGGGTNAQPTKPVKGGVKTGAAKGAAAGPEGAVAGAAVGTFSRIGKGVGHAADGAKGGGGGVITILVIIFLVVGLAKLKGANVQTSKALFGGFVLAVILSALAKLNNKIAVGFAFLVLITCLSEYYSYLSGIFSGTSTIPTAVPGYNPSNPASSNGANGLTGAVGTSQGPVGEAITGPGGLPTVANTSGGWQNDVQNALQTAMGAISGNPVEAATGAGKQAITYLRDLGGSLF